jgi:hypothetical protein
MIGAGVQVGIGPIRSGKKSFFSYWSKKLFNMSDLNFRVRSRVRLSLIDDYGNNASILMPAITHVSGYDAYKIDTGIIPVANTVWVFKARSTTLTNNDYMGSIDSGVGAFSVAFLTSNRLMVIWGTPGTGAFLAGKHDTNWHTFIMYNKSLWLVDPSTALTDANIMNVINNVAPDGTDNSGSWAAVSKTIKLYGYDGSALSLSMDLASSFIGTITGGVITWQQKLIFNNTSYAFDVVTNTPIVTPAGTTLIYSVYGNTDCLEIGYSKYFKLGETPLNVPYVNGSPGSPTLVPTGFVKVIDIPGYPGVHNFANSLIRFPLGGKWDRSNTTIFKNATRAGFYDAANVTDWHTSELNQLSMHELFFNTDQDICFVKGDLNSIDVEDREELLELFSYGNPKTGNDLNKVLVYTGDYDYFL